MRLDEIKKLLDMNSLPFKWLDDHRCAFEDNETQVGIYVDFRKMTLNDGLTFSLANISFGTYESKFDNANDLQTGLTGRGRPRTIFSTVANACLKHRKIINSDLVVLGAGDEVKEKRSLLYSHAIAEIREKSNFADRNDIRVKTSNGTILNILSKITFSKEQQEEIAEALKLEKI